MQNATPTLKATIEYVSKKKITLARIILMYLQDTYIFIFSYIITFFI